MTKWKMFLDHITDSEDMLQRTAELSRFVGEDEVATAATAATAAADALLIFAEVMIRRGDRVPVVDTGYVLSGTSGSGAGASSVSSGDGATGL